VIIGYLPFNYLRLSFIDRFCEAVRFNDLSYVRTTLKKQPGLANEKGLYVKESPTEFLEIIKIKSKYPRKNPLFYAGTKEMAELLLIHGANVNAKTTDGRTPLHVMSLNACEDIVRLLIKNKADVNAKDNKGITPFSLLFDDRVERHDEIIELFITHGADVNVKTIYGETPLKWALDRKRNDIAELLRKHGAKE